MCTNQLLQLINQIIKLNEDTVAQDKGERRTVTKRYVHPKPFFASRMYENEVRKL